MPQHFEHHRLLPVVEQPELNGCRLLCTGHECQTSGTYRWDGMKRGPQRRCLWQLCLSGRGALRLAAQEYEIRPGDCMLLQWPEDHCYYLPPASSHWEVLYFLFDGSEAERLTTLLRRRWGSVLRVAENGPVHRAARELYEAIGNPSTLSVWDASARFYALLLAQAEELNQPAEAMPEPDRRLARLMAAARSTPTLSAAELQRASGYSPSYFAKVFRARTGMTPVAFLTDLRLNHAFRLLETTLLSVKEIAQASGFDDTAYFCRAFKRRFRRTPASLRK